VTERDSAVQRLRLAYAAGKIRIKDLHQRLEDLAGDPGPDTVRHVMTGVPAAPPNLRVAGSHKTYPLDAGVVDQLALITDPVERTVDAAQLAEQYAGEQETARKARNDALVSAHVRYGLPQAACYEPFGILRRPFRTAVRRAPAVLPDYGSAERSLEVAGLYNAQYEAARSKAETARLVRDVGIRTLIDGSEVTSAGMARALGMTTARIAQIRTDPPAKIAA
jgi:hypothetical protein